VQKWFNLQWFRVATYHSEVAERHREAAQIIPIAGTRSRGALRMTLALAKMLKIIKE